MIKAVVFDYMGVLSSEFGPTVYPYIQEVTGHSIEEIKAVFSKYWKDLKIGKISDEVFWQGMAKDLEVSAEDVGKVRAMTRKCSEPVQEMIDLVKEFSETYDLYILSNSAYDWTEFMYDQSPLKQYMKKTFFSHLLGLAKPDPAIYQLVIKEIGCKPEEILFTDDKLINVEAAIHVGMQGIHFTGAASFREAFKKLQ